MNNYEISDYITVVIFIHCEKGASKNFFSVLFEFSVIIYEYVLKKNFLYVLFFTVYALRNCFFWLLLR
jgi:hypothetical protein